MAFFWDIYGKKVLSGQQQGWLGTNELGFELGYIHEITGKLPAVRAMDLAGYTRAEPGFKSRHEVARKLVDWYAKSNGIAALCWHWAAPMGEKVVYVKETKFDLSRGLVEGTPEHEAIVRDLDEVAEELELLRDARVPVLWRPMHEANGRWFWWGAQGPEPFKRMWRMMFERFTQQHSLTNLLWVFSPGAAIDLADWYPGDCYVDIIGQDHYPMDGNNGPAKDIFDELVTLTAGTKIVGLSENGPIPDPERLVGEKAGWLFFTTWAGRTLTRSNSKEQILAAYTNAYVMNLGDLPKLKEYTFNPAGKAVQLAFVAAVPAMAVGSPARRAVIVAVEDAEGRIVREGGYSVTLALARNAAKANLCGATNVLSVNGLAVFADLCLDRANANCVLIASAQGLREARSSPSAVGPGQGIEREWWTNAGEVALPELDELATPPHGRRVVGKALEAPYNVTSNFVARSRGLITPPLNGAYTFWIASEGRSELWLGTNGAAVSKKKIAEITGKTPYSKWPHTHEAQSATVNLEAGRPYFVEVLQKQPLGSEHLSVRWRLPDGSEERPIPGYRLALLPMTESEVKREAGGPPEAK